VRTGTNSNIMMTNSRGPPTNRLLKGSGRQNK